MVSATYLHSEIKSPWHTPEAHSHINRTHVRVRTHTHTHTHTHAHAHAHTHTCNLSFLASLLACRP